MPPEAFLSMQGGMVDAYIIAQPQIEAAEAIHTILVRMASDPNVDKEFREQYFSYWSDLAQGKMATQPSGATEISGGQGLIGWLGQQGFKRETVVDDGNRDDPAAVGEPGAGQAVPLGE